MNARGDGDLFSGDTDVGIASFVYKWAPNGNPTSTQPHADRRVCSMARTTAQFNGTPLSQSHSRLVRAGRLPVHAALERGAAACRTGLGRSRRRLRGHRRSTILVTRPSPPRRLLECDTSEFGRLRLQYTHDESTEQDNDELVLQYTVIYGPHGAHRY